MMVHRKHIKVKALGPFTGKTNMRFPEKTGIRGCSELSSVALSSLTALCSRKSLLENLRCTLYAARRKLKRAVCMHKSLDSSDERRPAWCDACPSLPLVFTGSDTFLPPQQAGKAEANRTLPTRSLHASSSLCLSRDIVSTTTTQAKGGGASLPNVCRLLSNPPPRIACPYLHVMKPDVPVILTVSLTAHDASSPHHVVAVSASRRSSTS